MHEHVLLWLHSLRHVEGLCYPALLVTKTVHTFLSTLLRKCDMAQALLVAKTVHIYKCYSVENFELHCCIMHCHMALKPAHFIPQCLNLFLVFPVSGSPCLTLVGLKHPPIFPANTRKYGVKDGGRT